MLRLSPAEILFLEVAPDIRLFYFTRIYADKTNCVHVRHSGN